jgi:hypothetical protein
VGYLQHVLEFGAQEKTRTSTAVKPPTPEAGVSTNFTTWAYQKLALSMARTIRGQGRGCKAPLKKRRGMLVLQCLALKTQKPAFAGFWNALD